MNGRMAIVSQFLIIMSQNAWGRIRDSANNQLRNPLFCLCERRTFFLNCSDFSSGLAVYLQVTVTEKQKAHNITNGISVESSSSS